MLILIRITNGDLLEDKIIQIIPEFKYDDKDTKIDYDFQKQEINTANDVFNILPETKCDGKLQVFFKDSQGNPVPIG